MTTPKRILVTGGAGFIGSQVADHLVATGHQVAVVDNLSMGKREYGAVLSL
jgi:UDP-glucose 4-epimerase